MQGALSFWGEGVLRVPPIQQPDAVHGVQHHLHSLVESWLLAIVNRGVLEEQPHAMMPHVCAHVDGELQERDMEVLEEADVQKHAFVSRYE